jgi:Putative lumazine-binding
MTDLTQPTLSALTRLEQTIQTYFDGLYEGDVDKLARAFHPTACLYAEKDGAHVAVTQEQWHAAVKSRVNPAQAGLERGDRIVTIDFAGPKVAFVKVNCQIPPRYFTDYLTLLDLAEGWRIVSKTYHGETR